MATGVPHVQATDWMATLGDGLHSVVSEQPLTTTKFTGTKTLTVDLLAGRWKV